MLSNPITYLIVNWVLHRSLDYNLITTTCVDDKSQEVESITQYSTVLHSCYVVLTRLSDYALIASCLRLSRLARPRRFLL
jgi:hypothetical protein